MGTCRYAGRREYAGDVRGSVVTGGTDQPPISGERVEQALQRLRAEQDTISSALLDLENHHGHQLLDGAELTGVTERRWAATRGRIGSLWQMFDLYRRTLARVEELHARRPRPGHAELAELTHLITGAAAELAGEEIPLRDRSLLGPARASEWLTLDELVTRMNGVYAEVTEVVAAADAAWSELLPRLGRTEKAVREAEELLRSLEPAGTGHDRTSRIGRELAKVRASVLTDPLSLVRDGAVDTTAIDRLEAELATFRDELTAAAGIQAEFAGQAKDIGRVVERVEAAQTEAFQARERVLARIDSPALPPIRNLAGPLRDRLVSLGELHRQGRWLDLAKRTAGLKRSAADALDQISATLGAITAPLHRRDELRGRLEAYGAKAAQLGYGEDTNLARLHQQAHDLLWRAPCDLRQATMAVKTYQQAVGLLQRQGREPGEP